MQPLSEASQSLAAGALTGQRVVEIPQCQQQDTGHSVTCRKTFLAQVSLAHWPAGQLQSTRPFV